VASLSATSLAFGNVTVGSPAVSKAVTLSNTGNATLNITGTTVTGTGFSLGTNACGATLAAGASCTINVNFAPATATAATGTLSITDNATGSPHTVSLSGTGVTAAPQLAPPPTGLTATATVGSSTSIDLKWTASAGATGYNVYRNTGGATAVTTKVNATPVTTTSLTSTGLTAATAYQFQVTAVNAAGESAKAPVTPVQASTNPATGAGPTATAPKLNLVQNALNAASTITDTTAPTNANATVPVQVTWTGTGGTGLVYELQKSTDNGVTWTNALATANTTATSALLQLNQTTGYLFRVRATAGTTVGAWTQTAAAQTVTAVQEAGTGIAYSATGWSAATPSGNWAASTKMSTTVGNTVTYSFSGTNVAWIAKMFNDRGVATVTLDNNAPVDIDLWMSGTTGQARSLMFTANGLTNGPHTLKIAVKGASPKNTAPGAVTTRVEVDAFVTIK
jgi:hypothetical protein